MTEQIFDIQNDSEEIEKLYEEVFQEQKTFSDIVTKRIKQQLEKALEEYKEFEKLSDNQN